MRIWCLVAHQLLDRLANRPLAWSLHAYRIEACGSAWLEIGIVKLSGCDNMAGQPG
jgi:hypothetical protein